MNIDVSAEVQSALPDVMARLRENLMKRMEAEAQQVALEEVRKVVREWAAANLVPEIKAQLEAGKAGMVAAASACAEQLGNELTKAMREQAAKTLASGHVVSDIAQKLFRGF